MNVGNLEFVERDLILTYVEGMFRLGDTYEHDRKRLAFRSEARKRRVIDKRRLHGRVLQGAG